MGDTITVLNSNENVDKNEAYSLPLPAGGFKSISGEMAVQSYLIGKLEQNGKQLWLQANTEFSERDTKVFITCGTRPEAVVISAESLKKSEWDSAEQCLTLTLGHQGGAAEVTLRLQEYNTFGGLGEVWTVHSDLLLGGAKSKILAANDSIQIAAGCATLTHSEH